MMQHASPYLAMSNNPVSFTDPTGLWDGRSAKAGDIRTDASGGRYLCLGIEQGWSLIDPMDWGYYDNINDPLERAFYLSELLAQDGAKYRAVDKNIGYGNYDEKNNIATERSRVLDNVQTALDVVGLVPGLGEAADGVNGLIYYGRGDKTNAALSFAAMIPFAGWAATGGKLLGKFGGKIFGKVTKGGAPVLEGIYEFTAASGKKYVGQSGNIPKRIEQHIASGKLLPGTPVISTEVLGGKTAREVAEQLRINSLGGIYQNGVKVLENIRNPIGAGRQYLLNLIP